MICTQFYCQLLADGSAAAAEFTADGNDSLTHIVSLTADLAEEDKPVVYYIAGQSDSLTTTMGISGASNIMQDWIESNGGQFASAVLNLEGSEVTAEEIFEPDPDIIIVGGVYQHDLIEQNRNLT